jgi:metal-dependent amidase/aminoacylase/carboxypeptidase family protein
VPYSYWVFGGTDQKTWDKAKKEGKLETLPINHSAYFAPVIEPTLSTGTEAFVAAALSFLK